METLLARCLLLLVLYSIAATGLARQGSSITSPSACLSDIECPTTHYCSLRKVAPAFSCLPRLSAGVKCRSSITECKPGLHCGATRPSSDTKRCQKQKALGETCQPDDAFSCLAPNVCHDKTNICVPDTFGLAGDSCEEYGNNYFATCKQQFHCVNRKCKRKKSKGSCVNDFECAGICAGGLPIEFKGQCLDLHKQNQVCSRNSDCKQVLNPPPRTDELVCNIHIPSGIAGICVLESNLLRRLGQKCNREKDRCDARRGLSCRWANTLSRFACVHTSSSIYCEPGSTLSSCITDGTPRECRKPIFHGGYRPLPFFQCLRRRETRPWGTVCNRDTFTVCEVGTSCELVPGIGNKMAYPPPALRMCLKVRNLGGKCGNNLRVTCGKSLICKNGTCVKGVENRSVKVTHADFSTSCAKLPCVPGYSCEQPPGSFKKCVLPARTVGLGKVCYGKALFGRNCKSGQKCLSKRNGSGLRRCRVPHGDGSTCLEETDCSAGHSCILVRGSKGYTKRCYDPSKMVGLGMKCDPAGEGSSKRCWTMVDPSFVPITCLPAGGGFKCQQDADLFRFCSTSDDFGCVDRGTVCNESNHTCLPPREED